MLFASLTGYSSRDYLNDLRGLKPVWDVEQVNITHILKICMEWRGCGLSEPAY